MQVSMGAAFALLKKIWSFFHEVSLAFALFLFPFLRREGEVMLCVVLSVLCTTDSHSVVGDTIGGPGEGELCEAHSTRDNQSAELSFTFLCLSLRSCHLLGYFFSLENPRYGFLIIGRGAKYISVIKPLYCGVAAGPAGAHFIDPVCFVSLRRKPRAGFEVD